MIAGFNPWFALGGVLALLAAFVGGYAKGDGDRKARAELEKARYAQAVAKRFDGIRTRLEGISFSFEADKDVVYRDRDTRTETIREVFRNVEVPTQCAAPDGVHRVLTDAVDRANAAASGQSGPGLPAPAEPAEPVG